MDSDGDGASLTRPRVDLYQLFLMFGLPAEIPVKLYRHTPEKLREVKADGDLDIFQSVQTDDQLRGGLVAFFAGEGNRMARFTGMRRVISVCAYNDARGPRFEEARRKGYIGPGLRWYELDYVPGFEALIGRLLVVWPPGRLHYRWLLKKASLGPRRIDVHAVMPMGFKGPFPGFSNLLLTHAELAALNRDGDGGSGWIATLKATKGVYLITHLPSGKLYVGSATGEHGFWGRWSAYAENVHGGNKVLMQQAMAPTFKDNIQFSILETMSNLANKEAGLAAERRWKLKLGEESRTLNGN